MSMSLETAASCFGRGADVDHVVRLLEGAQIVGICGPPGVGKSTVARAAVAAVGRPRVYVELGSARSAVEATRALLAALRLGASPEEAPTHAMERLGHAVESGPARVFLLDDVDAVGDLGQVLAILRRAPETRVVVTARARPNSRDVEAHVLEALSPPAARELFIDRARRIQPGFQPDAASLAAIEQLVATVDYLPLAVELAASRMRVMSPMDLLRSAQSTLDLLRTRDPAPARHSSFRDALNCSWELLGDDERRVLAACSVYSDAFPLSAAQALFEPGWPVADVLEDLIGQSLLESSYGEGGVWFRMLNCLREYAREQLWRDERLGNEVLRRRASFTVQFATERGAAVEGAAGFQALGALESMRIDALEVCRELAERGDVENAARIVGGLRWNVIFRGPFADYRDLLEGLADPAQRLGPDVAAAVVGTLAEVEIRTGARQAAQSRVERLLHATAVETSPRAWLVLARALAVVLAGSRPAEALELLDDALDVARRQRDSFMAARLLERIGFARIQLNDVDGAWLAFSEAHELYAAGGCEVFTGEALTGLGYVELRQGRVTQAIERLTHVVELHRGTPGALLVAASHFNLGVVCHEGGQIDAAQAELEAALQIWVDGGFEAHLAPGLVRLGLVLAEREDTEAARATFTRALQSAEQCRDHHNAAVAYTERAALDLMAGRPVDWARLERMIPGIVVGADADAFASALILAVVVVGRARQPALPWVNRVEELVSLFAESDTHLRTVVRRLRDLARAWHLVEQARQHEGTPVQPQLGAQAFEHASDAIGSHSVDEAQLLPNPFVRMWARRLFRAAIGLPGFAPPEAHFRNVLLVHRNGEWYRLGDRAPVDLSTRRPLRLIMARLAEISEAGEPRGLDVDDIAQAGWPGEQLSLSTRRNRVYTAIRFLREMDLDDILVTSDDGYGFARDIAVRLTDEHLRE